MPNRLSKLYVNNYSKNTNASITNITIGSQVSQPYSSGWI